MSGEPIKVTLYVWPERDDRGGEVWHAECVTLNLVARRASLEEVKEAMAGQIASYLQVARGGDPRGLIPRYSPLRRRVVYWLRYQFSNLLPRPPIHRQEEILSRMA